MCDLIPLSVPSIRGNEWKYIKECLDTQWVSSAGKYVEKFEAGIAKFTGAKYAIACINGTAALHVALQLTGVTEGDEVIVPTLTFIAPVNVVRYLRANPVFMDCDEFYNIDIGKTIEFIERQTVFCGGVTLDKRTKRRIAAIITVHIFGNAVRLDDLVKVCMERNIRIIEDATESLGTFYKADKFSGRHTGTIGSLGCLSFNGNKIITTGGGGMLLTNDDYLAEKGKYLITQAKDDKIRYIHNEVGYNYRLTNLQAALGVAQLESLPSYLETKKKNYFNYKHRISQVLGLHLVDVPPYANNNYWMYALQIDPSIYRMDREALMQHLKDCKIETRPVWYLNHLQKPYKDYEAYRIDKAIMLHKTTLNIPCSVSLKSQDIERVVEELA